MNQTIQYSNTFITKYKPYFLKDFYMDDSIVSVINVLFEMDDLNILFVSNPNSGKTTLLYAIIREYYNFSYYRAIKYSLVVGRRNSFNLESIIGCWVCNEYSDKVD